MLTENQSTKIMSKWLFTAFYFSRCCHCSQRKHLMKTSMIQERAEDDDERTVWMDPAQTVDQSKIIWDREVEADCMKVVAEGRQDDGAAKTGYLTRQTCLHTYHISDQTHNDIYSVICINLI